MKPLSRYKMWLSECAKYFEVEEDDIVYTKKRTAYVSLARQAFYHLCLKDNINLYSLSTHLGKHRTSIYSSIVKSPRLRDKNAEKLIYEKNSM